ILYAGFSDPQISPSRTIAFYRALGEQEQGYTHLQERARLFMVPGMGHCGGGPGPNSFNTLMALDTWVSQGIAPEAILATNPGSGRTMPLCKFPEEARYEGAGGVNQAGHWNCRANDRRLLRAGVAGIVAGVGGEHEADRDEGTPEDDQCRRPARGACGVAGARERRARGRQGDVPPLPHAIACQPRGERP